jgi:hypothetical protein
MAQGRNRHDHGRCGRRMAQAQARRPIAGTQTGARVNGDDAPPSASAAYLRQGFALLRSVQQFDDSPMHTRPCDSE